MRKVDCAFCKTFGAVQQETKVVFARSRWYRDSAVATLRSRFLGGYLQSSQTLCHTVRQPTVRYYVVLYKNHQTCAQACDCHPVTRRYTSQPNGFFLTNLYLCAVLCRPHRSYALYDRPRQSTCVPFSEKPNSFCNIISNMVSLAKTYTCFGR